MHLSDDEIKAKAQEANRSGPQVGEIYRHYKGGEYEIVSRPLDEETLNPLVIYRSLLHGTEWSRSLFVFSELIEVEIEVEVPYDGVSVPGFVVAYSGPEIDIDNTGIMAPITQTRKIKQWVRRFELIRRAENRGSRDSEKWLTERLNKLKAEREAGGAKDISG